MDYVVEMKEINMSFGNVHAVNDGEFTLERGEIHSLIGENGAGKSTLMKILNGIHRMDSGSIVINGEHFRHYNTKKAIQMGFGMVHQEFALVDELTVLENIILGFEPAKHGVIDFAKAREQINFYIREYGFDVNLDKRILDISVGEAQRVEILKTLYRGAEIIILDEPTAVLTPQETLNLFEILRQLKSKGVSIVFISHKLNEVMEISDRITIMRDGKYITTVKKDEITIPELANKMVGRDVTLACEKPPVHTGECVMSVQNVYVSSKRELSKIKNVSFDLFQGEILGIAGVDGNGQNELVEAIMGLREVEQGSILIKGQPMQNQSVLDIRNTGVAYIPDDRNTRGLNKKFSIMENLIANHLGKIPFSKYGILNKKNADDYSKDLVEKYDVRPRDPSLNVGNLSGGNAQKVVFAREIEADFDIFIAAQPTRGVDIGSIENIHKLINEIKLQGKSVLLVSAELEEIFALSDRIMVMYEGEIAGIVRAEDAEINRIGLLMTGGGTSAS
ncbi:heme ABC transporter ATP-binding protein [Clostridia bacterium]|nr:heme ABC transporter ATP-binding protein [Clostridia bacterium]